MSSSRRPTGTRRDAVAASKARGAGILRLAQPLGKRRAPAWFKKRPDDR
jgi:hypothetical protein